MSRVRVPSPAPLIRELYTSKVARGLRLSLVRHPRFSPAVLHAMHRSRPTSQRDIAPAKTQGEPAVVFIERTVTPLRNSRIVNLEFGEGITYPSSSHALGMAEVEAGHTPAFVCITAFTREQGR